uniref:ATP synthase F0 subunit 8 n=2 Tax=unclassified Mesabolivar TaxID=2625251 RepID=A0A411FER6_9ARAC|nr:ATP synthase F0 subunit 8 [Mesabolivar sp. ITV1036I1]YP_009554250.1 ATP synthase F0 subunit 8 [Mesabolivar sp. ITV1036I3]QBA91980.1 ATP synthase F0 subunit 8 [Mesabolivar sp. ITV1036I1]QBA92006.1 ATP synthase F0 subunit 8 [Mesabolivar sp. ITV1036I3]
MFWDFFLFSGLLLFVFLVFVFNWETTILECNNDIEEYEFDNMSW